MPVLTNKENIRVVPKKDEYFLSVFHPSHPIFRLHTVSSVITISSQFIQNKDRYELPLDSIVIKLDYADYTEIVLEWVEGKHFKQYGAFTKSIIEKIKP